MVFVEPLTVRSGPRASVQRGGGSSRNHLDCLGYAYGPEIRTGLLLNFSEQRRVWNSDSEIFTIVSRESEVERGAGP